MHEDAPKSYSFESFSEHARAINARFEERRAHFLTRLRWHAGIALLLLLSFPFWFRALTEYDDASGLGWTFIHILAGIIVIAAIIAFAVRPLYRYRNYTEQFGSNLPGVSGIMQEHISLKAGIFTQLLRYFGPFQLYADRKLSLRSILSTPFLPAFDRFESEDYIKGSLEGISIELTEARFCLQHDQHDITLFNGLLIVMDISDPDLSLRGKFAGKTVVTLGEGHANHPLLGFDGFPLQDDKVTAYTTDAQEAQRLLTQLMLKALKQAVSCVQEAKGQERHIDDRLAFAIEHVANRLSDGMATAAEAALNWFNTGRLRIRSTRHGMHRHDTPLSPEARHLQEFAQCAFFEDKIVLAIPYEHNLFEPDMIFSKPLHAFDIKLLYCLMTAVDAIAEASLAALPKAMVE